MTIHEKHTLLNDFQFQSFSIWKNNKITKELIDEYNEKSLVNEKQEIIDNLMKKLPDDVMVYQSKSDYHIFRLVKRKIRCFLGILPR